MSLAGKIAYNIAYRPWGAVRTSLLHGGPWQQYLTGRGEDAMRAAALRLPVPSGSGPELRPHLLTGRRFWHQTAFCLWSLSTCSGRSVAPVIHDDGTLDESHRDTLRRLFPAARFISRTEALKHMDTVLPATRFPHLRERWLRYPQIRKLTDPHAGSHGWKLVIDSDLLFFRRPDFLLRWSDSPDRPLHAVDCQTAYGYSRDLMHRLSGAPVADLINVGLAGLNSSELDWERIEYFCRELIGAEGPHYFLEQALIAMLVAGRDCAVAPAADYVTLPRQPEATACRAVMHHYVVDSKRWYFQRNWRRFAP